METIVVNGFKFNIWRSADAMWNWQIVSPTREDEGRAFTKSELMERISEFVDWLVS